MIKKNELRLLYKQEIKLLKTLLNEADWPISDIEINTLLVCEMNDGGMGSLYFYSPTKKYEERQLLKSILNKDYIDSDNITIHVSLNIDKDKKLFELDIWKVNFGQIVKYPESE